MRTTNSFQKFLAILSLYGWGSSYTSKTSTRVLKFARKLCPAGLWIKRKHRWPEQDYESLLVRWAQVDIESWSMSVNSSCRNNPKTVGTQGWMITGQVSWRASQANSTEKATPFPVDLRRPRALAANQIQKVEPAGGACACFAGGLPTPDDQRYWGSRGKASILASALVSLVKNMGGGRHSRVCIHNTNTIKIKQACARGSVVGSIKTKCGGEHWDAAVRNLGCWALWQSLTQQQQHT